MNRLCINQLSLTYQPSVKVLDNISLEISHGMFGLLGPNGAGKSSLMKTIVGLQQPNSGNIIFNGTDVVKNPGYLRKQLGFLPQDFGVYPSISAYHLLQHLAVLKGITDSATRKAQILYLLNKVNLYQVRDKDVYTFSGGMKQRFGVAQALLGNPQLIIVDEPTAGLDPEERNRLNFLLSDISENVVVMLSTHLVEDVQNLCSQMAIIKRGTVLATGTPGEMIARLNGKVWTQQIDHLELTQHQNPHRLISQQLIERKLHITVYSETPPEGFIPVIPTLEHVYFHTLYHESNPAI
ncbi:ABC-type multidrug transport system ATPase subunit [Chitinophaga polysaccharea]|uniref:ABC-type multidrug transport system ATPase subunit n=1 Tax=Chitinophaga polysaccharea TaxID=1293035 RepID=A0A561Q4J9_9BACT|nr:ABC transporter ATP-binding protein [Chitinophaga polysaccharea]TWF45297.1 ABC-type multidrug transport system ATPase subunit [Chitinophaga polysaccharea]